MFELVKHLDPKQYFDVEKIDCNVPELRLQRSTVARSMWWSMRPLPSGYACAASPSGRPQASSGVSDN